MANGAAFLNLNRNKRGIALDLNNDKGREIALKLAAKADVLVESFTPGVMDKLGLGYDIISRLNPTIIYCSISGFGQTGPYRERPAYDPVAQAMSGVMAMTGEAGRPPVRTGPSTIDFGTGILGAYSVAIALLNRQKNGKGQKIDAALLDTGVFYVSPFITTYSLTGKLPARMGSANSFFVPYQTFQAKDRPVYIGVSNEKAWKNFCQELGLDNLLDDPRYATNANRCQNRDELVETLSQILKQYDSEELVTKLVAVDIPCAPVLNVGELIEDSQVIAREMITDVDYPGKGKVKLVRTPIRFSQIVPRSRSQSPSLGEHTGEILKELGYGQTEIDQLAKAGIILQHTY